MVETQLCKLRDTSDTFVGRCSIFHFIKKMKNVSCEYTTDGLSKLNFVIHAHWAFIILVIYGVCVEKSVGDPRAVYL